MSTPSRDSLGVDARSHFKDLVAAEELVAQSDAALESLRALRDGRSGEPLADDAPIPGWAQAIACEVVGLDLREARKVAKTADGTRALMRRLAELRAARDGAEPDPAAVLDEAIARVEAEANQVRRIFANRVFAKRDGVATARDLLQPHGFHEGILLQVLLYRRIDGS
jgi:hypothetical protein